MKGLIRTLLRIPPPRISREEALRIAREECQKRGWDAIPVLREVREGVTRYTVRSPYFADQTRRRFFGHRSHVRFEVDFYYGRVLKARIVPAAAAGSDDAPGGATAGRPVRPKSGPPRRRAGNAKPLSEEASVRL